MRTDLLQFAPADASVRFHLDKLRNPILEVQANNES